MSTLERGVPPRMPDTIMPRQKIFPPAVGDHCYLRHGDRALMARVFMPRGDTGPFPCLLALHGGGWQRGDLENRNSCGGTQAISVALSRPLIYGRGPTPHRAASSPSSTAS